MPQAVVPGQHSDLTCRRELSYRGRQRKADDLVADADAGPERHQHTPRTVEERFRRSVFAYDQMPPKLVPDVRPEPFLNRRCSSKQVRRREYTDGFEYILEIFVALVFDGMRQRLQSCKSRRTKMLVAYADRPAAEEEQISRQQRRGKQRVRVEPRTHLVGVAHCHNIGLRALISHRPVFVSFRTTTWLNITHSGKPSGGV